MIAGLKKLVENNGAAQVCVWLDVKDTRTIHTWISRKTIPFHAQTKVKILIKKKEKN